MSSAQKLDQIVKTFSAACKSKKDLENLLLDILTPAEIEDIGDRLNIIQALLKNDTQRDVSKNLSVSISKVTRGSHAIKEGSGVLKKILG